jgi:hypothetical protein
MKKRFASWLKLSWCALFVAICCCAVAAAAMPASSAEPVSPAAEDQSNNTIEDEAVQALYTMSSYLRTLSAFEMKSRFFRDEVLTTGQKVLISGKSSTLIRMPDKFLANVTVDEKNKDFQVYFDGQNMTLYGKNHQFYVTTPAPGTVADLVFKTFAEKGIELPLQDIFLWGTNASDKEALTSAFQVGTTVLNGKKCTHYAFRQKEMDWQVWIQDGEQPLPRRVVITTTSDASQPQYSASIDWDLNPAVPDDLFAFTPPKGARAIDFLPARRADSQE